MKKLIHFAAVICAVMAVTTLCWAQAASSSASRTDASLFLNDSRVSIGGYNIDGSNYFRIRDLAKAFNGTSASFEVVWNASASQVELLTGQPYTGEEEDRTAQSLKATAVPSQAQLMVDGQTVDVTAYNIGGSNYYKLRDLSGLLGYEVFWLEEENSICLYTGLGEHARMTQRSGAAVRQMSAAQSTARWAENAKSFLFENGDGSLTVLDASGEIVLDTYDRNTFELLSTRTVPTELSFFGGFFMGDDNAYIAFGQDNAEENNQKEVIRVVKYDKNFQRLASTSITGGDSFTIEPFRHGAVRMAERDGELVIHTSRKRYTTEDGKNHQSQLTILLDTETMRVQNGLGRFQDNHVSHSFNQFVQYDGESHVLVDHGDAYPRSVVLHKSGGSSYKEVDLFQIPGASGANCTGVTVGGFEVSGRNYLVAVNTIDHSKASGYDNFNISGITQDERDIVLLVCGRSDLQNVRQVKLTDYTGHGRLGSTPYLVKLSDDRLLVLWEEYEYTGGDTASRGVRYVFVDGDGQPTGTVQSLPDARLPADCQPVCIDGTVIWYLNQKAGRVFYQIPV